VEPSRGRWLMLQGHPEYEAVSLLKEYKREVRRWRSGERPDHPPVPEGYFSTKGCRIAARFAAACRAGEDPGVFPEKELLAQVDDRWTAAAVKVVGNWLNGLGA